MHIEGCQVVALGRSQAQSDIKSWERFYESVFHIRKNFSTLAIPERREGFERLVIVAQGMDFHTILSAMGSDYKISLPFPFDGFAHVISPRTPERDYAVWTRDDVECDDDLRGVSRDKLVFRGIQFQTIEEHLLHRMKFFRERHRNAKAEDGQLDRIFRTLTSSSDRFGNPIVTRLHDLSEIRINVFDARRSHGAIGARQVVV